MIDATRFRELWEAYCTHSANLKSAEEAGTELETDYIDEEEARQLLGSFFVSHAAELLALVEASTGKPMLIDGDERTTVRIFTPYAPTSPGAIIGMRKAETPCSDCIDGWCQMNCGPRVG
jgi:hypothetical protein